VSRATRLLHGKTSQIYHYKNELFSGIPSPFTATRYHSLIVEEDGLPDELEIIAFTDAGEIMGLKHKEYPVYGLQFHPESILTETGKQILKNFTSLIVPTIKGKKLMLKSYIAKVVGKQNLTQEESFHAMEIIMTGQATPAQIGGYLIGLRMKGETMSEIIGSAQAMRSVANQISPKGKDVILDTAGTGGDGSHSINISTTAAFVIAGAGYCVAKHGNRAASSKCGSADVLEELSVQINLTPDQVKQCIEEIGIGFMFAPLFHPAMKHAIGPRRELAQRTIFNVLGPLTNPANATHQLIGVYDPILTETLARVLGALNVKGAMVVHSKKGLDELSTDGVNTVSKLQNGNVESYEFVPQDFGLRPADQAMLKGSDPAFNAKTLRAILDGSDDSPRRDVVALNAAAAISTVEGDLKTNLEKANAAIDDGSALTKLEALIDVSQRIGVVA
jgi:anthranilate phosphoribosyltransferase